ncbi:MAG: class I SAM-dependent methyltransferase [Polyangiaceae bacterium]
MNAPAETDGHGVGDYLRVRYSEEARPYTSYPDQLTRYLTARFLKDHRGGRLLDLGCGRGEFLNGFSRQGFRVTGFDRAQPDGGTSAPIVLGDYERDGLPFEDSSFDIVFNKSVLEHTHDITRLLRECRRILRPGGRLVSLVPDWKAQWSHFYDDWTHVRPFTLTGLDECLRCHGFDVRVAERFRQLPFLWEHPYLRPVASVAARLPSALKRYKLVRFSKEWMLLAVADR